jgi:hypothetical protein
MTMQLRMRTWSPSAHATLTPEVVGGYFGLIFEILSPEFRGLASETPRHRAQHGIPWPATPACRDHHQQNALQFERFRNGEP